MFAGTCFPLRSSQAPYVKRYVNETIMSKKIDYKREYNPAMKLWAIARGEQYLCERDDSNLVEHHCMVGMIFTAFSYEAMVNRYGKKLFKSIWNELERLSSMSKTKVIYDKIDLKYDIGTQHELQMIQQLFKFRNFAAHGKSDEYTGQTEVGEHVNNEVIIRNIDENMPIKQMEFCSLDNLEKVIDATEKIQKKIDEKGKLHCLPLHVSGISTWASTD